MNDCAVGQEVHRRSGRHRLRRLAIAGVVLAVAALVVERRLAAPPKPSGLPVAAVTARSSVPPDSADDPAPTPVSPSASVDTASERCATAVPGALDEGARQAAVDRYKAVVVDRLQATGDPVDRAVAVSLGERADAMRPAWLAQVDAVARSAVLTADSRLYGLALSACASSERDAGVGPAQACGQLSWAQWLRIDPDNGRLWLAEAYRARGDDDPQAESDAVFHAANAGRYEQPVDVAPRRLLLVMQANDPAWLRYAVLRELMLDLGLSSRHATLSEAARLSGSCADEALDDPNRRELCTRLANRLLDGSVAPDSVWPGIMIAQALQWPAERIAGRRRDAWSLVTAKSLLPLDQLDCGGAGNALALLETTLEPDAATLLQAERPRRLLAAMQARRQIEEAQAEAAKAGQAEEPEVNAIADE